MREDILNEKVLSAIIRDEDELEKDSRIPTALEKIQKEVIQYQRRVASRCLPMEPSPMRRVRSRLQIVAQRKTI